jgi:hypothetical protein
MNWPALCAEIACGTGWTIPHIREEVDLPTVDALRAQWEQYPPLHILMAHRYGAAKPRRPAALQPAAVEEQDYIPANRLSAAAFDDVLRAHRLPTDQHPGPPGTPPT